MSLTKQQVDALLRPIHPSRVLQDNKGMAHVSQQDIRAHLTRIFGFAGWSDELLDLTLIREAPGKDKQGKDKGWAVTYRATVRLTVRDPQGRSLASYDDVGTGTSPNLPTVGDAHDFACKVAVSMALKRAATNLGDGFGLSLYNKGQRSALVKGTLVVPEGEGTHVEDVPEQVSMGHDDAGSVEEPERPAERTRPTTPALDEWSTSDAIWVKEWQQLLESASTKDELAVAWANLNAAVASQQVIPADEPGLREQWTARKEELFPPEVEGQVAAWDDVEVAQPAGAA